jgi:hypothetical protein
MIRDIQADWKHWTRAERIIAITSSLLLAIAVPVAYLITLA